MLRSTLASLLLAVVSVVSASSCVEESQTPPPVNAPTSATATVAPAASASATAASTTAPSATAPSPSADGAPDAAAPSQVEPGTPLGALDGGAPAQFRACTMDSDCAAVPRAGCCRNGWLEAVAVSQKDAYARAEKCGEPHPICPMYIVQDERVALCDDATHLCTMTPPDQVSCGGFFDRNHRHCPAGYGCKKTSKIPDVGGKCVKEP